MTLSFPGMNRWLPVNNKWWPQGNHGKESHVWAVNTLRPRQNGCHFADGIFTCIFFNENAWILIKISLKFVPKGPINNIPALVLITAWCRPGNKPLSEPMMVTLKTHICVTGPHWVNAKVSMVLNKEVTNSMGYYLFTAHPGRLPPSSALLLKGQWYEGIYIVFLH